MKKLLQAVLFLTIAAPCYSRICYADKQPAGPKSEMVGLRDREAWDSLSEEEKTKLKEALRKVWSDPAVVSARGDIQRAADDYRDAMKNAVSNSDPEIAALLEKVQSANEGHFKERIGSRMGGIPGSGKRNVEFFLHPPGYLESLSKEEQTQYRNALGIAKETPELKKAFAEVEKIRNRDEEVQKAKVEAIRNLRRTYIQEMVKADPEVEKIIPRGGFPKGDGPPSSPNFRKRKGKGEGDDSRSKAGETGKKEKTPGGESSEAKN